MSNQDLNELKSINNQLEQLQNQKRIIQQKLQDENDMMMVENHLFSQSEIQELIKEIEKDFPDFKINIDYKENKLTFNCQNIDIYKFPEQFKEITKKDLLSLLETQLNLKPIYMILINSGFVIKESSSNHQYHQIIKAYNKDKNIKTQIVLDEKLNIRHLKTYKSILNETIVSFKLKKYNVEMIIDSGSHYNSYNGCNDDDLFSIYANEENYPNVIVKGIHYFAGTQRKKNDKQIKELDMLLGLIKEIQTTFNRKVEQIEYGPGLSVPLFEGDDFSDTLKPLENIHAKLKELSEVVDLTIEMGRFYSTFCGTYLTRAMDCKSNEGVNYCIVDGGMNHLNYYGQMMGMKVPHIQHLHACDDRTEMNWCLCGSLCTTADVLVRDVTLQGLHEGDYLAFNNCGAYSVTEGIHLFLSRTMPLILLRTAENEYIVARQMQESYPINTIQNY